MIGRPGRVQGLEEVGVEGRACHPRITRQTPDQVIAAMQVHDAAAPSLLVQSVHVLSDDSVYCTEILQECDAAVSFVRLRL